MKQIKRFSTLILISCALVAFTNCSNLTKKDFSPPFATQKNWFKAARTGDITLLKKLHEEGFPFDHQDQNGVTALKLACRYGNQQMIEYLINEGADINQVDQFGYNALSYLLHGPTTVDIKSKISFFLIRLLW